MLKTFNILQPCRDRYAMDADWPILAKQAKLELVAVRKRLPAIEVSDDTVSRVSWRSGTDVLMGQKELYKPLH